MTAHDARPALVWFRDDLRTTDHAALAWAAGHGPVVGLFIAENLPDDEPATEEPGSPALGPRPLGGASRWWLHHSLHALAADLADLGIELIVESGDPRDIVPRLAADLDAATVTWHRRYGPGARALDAAVKATLSDSGDGGHEPARTVASHPGYLLNEPWEVRTKQDGAFKVYTPFSRASAEALTGPDAADDAPDGSPRGRGVTAEQLHATRAAIDALALTPSHPSRPEPDWTSGLGQRWSPGERGAHERLADFLLRLGEGVSPADRRISADGVEHRYADGRDYMALDSTSRLSPHLRFGEISPRRAWAAVAEAVETGDIDAEDGNTLHKELLWRDFAWHRHFHLPALATANTRPTFDAFPWSWQPGELDHAIHSGRDPRGDGARGVDPDHGPDPRDHDHGPDSRDHGDGAARDHLPALSAWRRGETGIALVDAGMRELWESGYVHNRVRMVAGSLLTKNLGIHWRHGEEWFWETLVDADEASNPFNWQWVAGCGDDAAPYFRIFNPETQAKKFDPESVYVRRWVPEFGTADYPAPIVDLKKSRASALDAYEFVKSAAHAP